MSDEQVKRFEMPRPHRGQAVVFYGNGIVSEQQGTIGFVTMVGAASIEIAVQGLIRDTVCHKDDPAVKDNVHVRKAGCWDFCGRDLEIDNRLTAIEAKVDTLLAAIQGQDKKNKST